MARKRTRKKARSRRRSTALARSAPMVRHSAPRIVHVSAPKRRSIARRVGGAISGSEDRAFIVCGASSLALGYAKYKQVNIPHIPQIGVEATIAIAAYAAAKFGLVKGQWARDAKNVALSAGSVALFQIGENGFALQPPAAHGDDYPGRYEVR